MSDSFRIAKAPWIFFRTGPQILLIRPWVCDGYSNVEGKNWKVHRLRATYATKLVGRVFTATSSSASKFICKKDMVNLTVILQYVIVIAFVCQMNSFRNSCWFQLSVAYGPRHRPTLDSSHCLGILAYISVNWYAFNSTVLLVLVGFSWVTVRVTVRPSSHVLHYLRITVSK